MPLMIGSTGPRMLAIALPHVQAWNAWFSEFQNLPENVPALLDRFAACCHHAGRDPAEIEKSVALLLDFGSPSPRNHSINPITGSRDQMADAVARVVDAGVDHIQFVLDPITEGSIERLAEVVGALRR
jgi:alkanesulfonate monooxygenase SsuD/methylene tetrahydromethanopterin reductase-like flavin-dependent oxidoreductase (luciferase family)